MPEKIVFELLKRSLFTDEDLLLPEWQQVFLAMKEQAVAAIPGEWLKNHPFPEVHVWSSYCLFQQVQWIKIMYGQENLLKLLGQHGIPCVIIKGAAAAMSYPYPKLRTMGDVDIMVKREDFERSAALMEANGYLSIHEKGASDYHYEYSKDKICFELHKRLRIVQESDEKLLALFEQGIDRREIQKIDDYSFPTFPSDLNGLVFIFHINQHLRGGLGLRQIIDWMMYINNLPECVWQNQVLPMLQEIGMERLALTVTAMCQKYLGLRKIVEHIDDYPCDELMAYIMEKGNFGYKAGDDGKAEFIFLDMSNPVRVFKRLQKGGLSQWKTVKKYSFLRPFAWIFQSFRILGTLAKKGTSFEKLMKQRRNGLKQRKLIESLGLSVDRDIKSK